MNGVDINRFQFEYDLTWMSFFQNSKGQTYARYGGREDAGPESHLNQASLARTMKRVLELHESNAVKPASKYEPQSKIVATPDELPTMQKNLAKRKNKCIHCHEVKATQLKNIRSAGKLTKEMVFTYPSPSNLGIRLDPKNQSLIKAVDSGSPAALAGLQANDTVKQFDGQRVLTYGDAIRVLELAANGDSDLSVDYERNGSSAQATVALKAGWKTKGDPSWRESGHIVGPNSGFWGVKLNAAQRKSNKIAADELAIKITAIWGKWAKQANLKHGDVVVSIDGKKTDMGIKQLQSYLHMNKNWGDKVELMIRRNGKMMTVKMNLPSAPTD